MAVASLIQLCGKADISFCLPERGGMPMYLTLEELILLAGFILALVDYIDRHKNKKK